ncbi:acyltransferase domain-containing protein, partial [Amycolatopsis sp. SID8362]|uniref:acyltransferase domain-containing protein n=1 Tax=Amycolatopsis sp. SID8362 TaxID=2690346 RepID=UPI001EF29682
MDPVLGEFRAIVEQLSFAAPSIPIVSTVTGAPATAGELSSPEYWVEHVRRPVRFADAVTALAEAGAATFVDLGPDGSAAAMAQEAADAGSEAAFVPLLRRDTGEETAVLTALAKLHAG